MMGQEPRDVDWPQLLFVLDLVQPDPPEVDEDLAGTGLRWAPARPVRLDDGLVEYSDLTLRARVTVADLHLPAVVVDHDQLSRVLALGRVTGMWASDAGLTVYAADGSSWRLPPVDPPAACEWRVDYFPRPVVGLNRTDRTAVLDLAPVLDTHAEALPGMDCLHLAAVGDQLHVTAYSPGLAARRSLPLDALAAECADGLDVLLPRGLLTRLRPGWISRVSIYPAVAVHGRGPSPAVEARIPIDPGVFTVTAAVTHHAYPDVSRVFDTTADTWSATTGRQALMDAVRDLQAIAGRSSPTAATRLVVTDDGVDLAHLDGHTHVPLAGCTTTSTIPEVWMPLRHLHTALQLLHSDTVRLSGRDPSAHIHLADATTTCAIAPRSIVPPRRLPN